MVDDAKPPNYIVVVHESNTNVVYLEVQPHSMLLNHLTLGVNPSVTLSSGKTSDMYLGCV
jgi:hypothetical protein